MIQPELKICHITETIGLSFEGLNFVVYPLNEAGRDTIEVLARFGTVGQARAVVELHGEPGVAKPIIDIRYEPRQGGVEHLEIP